jgi:thioredoxin-related protein
MNQKHELPGKPRPTVTRQATENIPQGIKKTLAFSLLLSVIFLPGNIKAQEKQENKSVIQWHSFEEAYNLNKKKHKKIFVDVYTDWCGWCKKMDKETFQDPDIAKYMQKNFYCVKLNAERKDTVEIDGVKFTNTNPGSRGGTHKLAIDLLRGKMSYPSYVFIDENNQTLSVVPGYMTAADFAPVLHFFAENAYKDKKWEEYKAGYNKIK